MVGVGLGVVLSVVLEGFSRVVFGGGLGVLYGVFWGFDGFVACVCECGLVGYG